MRFIVTGAGGFLGSNVIHELLANSFDEVVAVTSKTEDDFASLLRQIDGGDATHEGRLTVIEPADLVSGEVLRSTDVVIGSAFPWNRGGRAMAKGLGFLFDLYEAAAQAKVRTFVNVSSQSVYSQQRTTPAHEQSDVECYSPYSTAKYAIELAGRAILPGGTLINARMSSLIGPGYDIRIVNRFIKNVLDGKPIVVQGGDQSFDFMDVRDAARALVTLGREGYLDGCQVVNVGASRQLSLVEIVETIVGVLEDEDLAPEVQWSVGDDNRSLGLDSSLFREAYGFEANYSFEDSVRSIYQHITAEAN